MRKQQELLKEAITVLDDICEKMIQKENYQEKMSDCIQAVNGAVIMIMEEQNSNQEYILQLLEDMMYGMSQQDEVFLLDVLRFGLKAGFEEVYQQLEN